MKQLVLLVILTIIAFTVGIMIYLGAFKPVELAVSEEGPMRVVQKVHVGAYHTVVKSMEQAEEWARANNEPCKLSFGEYLDNPNAVEEDRLKSNVGCLVEKEWTAGLPEGFTYREIPRRLYVIAKFDGGPSIGPLKVYPKAGEKMKEDGLVPDGPVIEVYEIISKKEMKTKYFFPAKKP